MPTLDRERSLFVFQLLTSIEQVRVSEFFSLCTETPISFIVSAKVGGLDGERKWMNLSESEIFKETSAVEDFLSPRLIKQRH